jgi:probable rRNA maturation factor
MSVAVSNRQRLLKVNARQLTKLAQAVLQIVDATADQLSIVLVTDKVIAKLNKDYHGTDAPTDILSFDYSEGQGELVISVERAIAQAKRFHTTPSRELMLYVVHGILHLHGRDDRTAQQLRQMKAGERLILERLRRKFDFAKLSS